MKLTLEKLESLGACEEGVEWYKEQNTEDFEEICNRLLKSEYIEDYLNWILPRMMNKKQKVQYAIFAAELVIDNFEKVYPDDDRPRKAIEAALKYVKNQTEENKSGAARAAYSAAYSADSAARETIFVKCAHYGMGLLNLKVES